MTSAEPRTAASGVGIGDFPGIGERMRLAYLDLWLAESTSDQEQVQTLGVADDLPRPWDPATCRDAELRREVWQWLDQVVDWINTEYGWDVTGLIPGCWYRHPHLVHDLGAVADQRRRAGSAFTSDDLEEWQRYCLPMFLDRMRIRVRSYCDESHKDPPGRARILRYKAIESTAERQAWYDTEVREATTDEHRANTGDGQFLSVHSLRADPRAGEFA